MSVPRQPDGDLQALPAALLDQMFALLFGDPQRRAEAFARLVAANREHAEALQAHFRRQLEMEGGNGESAEPPDSTAIPGYQFLSVLGEGGMGTVWRAEQLGPVHRLVALKVIKPGMDSKAVLARFEQERQALAAMDHDAIAKIFDCGTTPRGQPYFAMELVEGLPIQRYCDEQRLSLKQRIELFLQVCQGVQHAHLKGVIHRDLKPGNVLVVAQEGRHAVKIIDFGVARAMDRRLSTASLFTEEGMVVGTPEYMSPEQAAGDVRRIDMRTDVYSLGVILYELLVGELPFPGAELRAAALAEVQRRLCEDEPPKPSTRLSTMGAAATACAALRGIGADALRRELARDLDWVVLKAMAKEPERRYESPTALSDDLRRYLAHEPLVAGPPSAGYRLRKFVRRYRGRIVAGSAVFLTAVVGAVVALQFALRERAKVREFDLLSGVVLYDRLIQGENDLYPPWPHKVGAMERWLRECDQLLGMRREIEQTVTDLRSRALPATQEEVEADRLTHPRYGDWQQLERKVAGLRRAQAVREGRTAADIPDLPAEAQAKPAYELNRWAWQRVAPKDGLEDRTVFGMEAVGLAYARAALARSETGDASIGRHLLLDTLAWSLFANGRDQDARQRSDAALAAAPPAEQQAFGKYRQDLEEAIGNAVAYLAKAEEGLAELTAQIGERRTYDFAADDTAARFLCVTLGDLLDKLTHLEGKEKAGVHRRLGWAQQIADLSLHHPRALHAWADVRVAVAASELYRDQAIELRDQDMTGLVPIGENPQTRLWEFYELRSAWDGEGDPREIAIPRHRDDGSIEVTGESGIVFVLLPGATLWMGAQKDSSDQPNFDPMAFPNESPVHQVTLAPFFLARHELTRAQWLRLTDGDRPFLFIDRANYENDPIVIGPTHPAESIDWDSAKRWMHRHGLVVPTEAQWEYGCRARTTTPWWSGKETRDLDGAGNMHDLTSFARHREWGEPAPFTDGFTAMAPVGSFRANDFGLHDVHGNVWEWCRDSSALHSYWVACRPGDGYRMVEDFDHLRIHRGGSSDDRVEYSRSASRGRTSPLTRNGNLGLRPARALQP